MSEEKKEDSAGLLNSLIDQISGSKEDQSKASFPVMWILLGAVVIIISIMGIRLALAKRKAAQLAWKLAKVEEENETAKENERLAESSLARQTARLEQEALKREAEQLRAKIEDRRKAAAEEAEQLKSITSWDDIKVVDAR